MAVYDCNIDSLNLVLYGVGDTRMVKFGSYKCNYEEKPLVMQPYLFTCADLRSSMLTSQTVDSEKF